jgi:hypothetical protein
MTFDDVTSGEKSPLGWILRNFRLRMCAPFQGNPEGVTWRLMMSHPVAMSIMRNGTFCTTIVRKKRGNLLRMRRTYFRSCNFRSKTSGDVTSGSSTSSNATLAVLIYYLHITYYRSPSKLLHSRLCQFLGGNYVMSLDLHLNMCLYITILLKLEVCWTFCWLLLTFNLRTPSIGSTLGSYFQRRSLVKIRAQAVVWIINIFTFVIWTVKDEWTVITCHVFNCFSYNWTVKDDEWMLPYMTP